MKKSLFWLSLSALSCGLFWHIGGLYLPVLAQPNPAFSNQFSQCQPVMETRQELALVSLAACDRALAEFPNNVHFLGSRASALRVLGRYEDAIATLDRISAIDPNFYGLQSQRNVIINELQISSKPWIDKQPILTNNTQVKRLVEALRLALLDTKTNTPFPLFSDWKMPPSAIASVSRRCLKRVVLPEEFAADSALARSLMECLIRKAFNDQLHATNKNELEAVRRTIAMHVSGLPDYKSDPFTVRLAELVVNYYQELNSNKPTQR